MEKVNLIKMFLFSAIILEQNINSLFTHTMEANVGGHPFMSFLKKFFLTIEWPPNCVPLKGIFFSFP
jgi:hypothetical protein